LKSKIVEDKLGNLIGKNIDSVKVEIKNEVEGSKKEVVDGNKQ